MHSNTSKSSRATAPGAGETHDKRAKRGPAPRRTQRSAPAGHRDQWERALAAKYENDRAGEFRKNLTATGGNSIKAGTSGALAMHRDAIDAEIPDPPNRKARRILAHYGPDDVQPGEQRWL